MMTRFVLSVCTAALAGIAAAQTFFRDDFNTLSPQWDIRHPMENSDAQLTYEINQGNLVATGVLPGAPWFDSGGSSFRRFFLPGGQYINGLTEQLRFRARFTLPRDDVIRSISFSLRNVDPYGFDNYGSITYGIQRLNNGQYSSRLRQYSQNGTSVSTFLTLDPVPYYDLEFFQEGNEIIATLNGMEVNRTTAIPAQFNQVTFSMGGSYGTTNVGSRLDYIEVVPEPIAIVGFAAAAAKVMLRKRKKKQP